MDKPEEKQRAYFADQLQRLGGNIVSSRVSRGHYIDLEEFFLDATIHIWNEERLANCVEHWVRRYGYLLSPSKIKRIIKEGHPYDPAVLGVYLLLIEKSKSKYKKPNFGPLKIYTSKKEEDVFRDNPRTKTPSKYFDEDWLIFGIKTLKFYPEFEKNLLTKEVTFKNSLELRNRIEKGVLSGDITSYFDRVKEGTSILQVAKKIHSNYANVYNKVKEFLDYKVIKESLIIH